MITKENRDNPFSCDAPSVHRVKISHASDLQPEARSTNKTHLVRQTQNAKTNSIHQFLFFSVVSEE
jgi:hypothetical protein